VHQLATPEAYFDDLMRREPSRPFVTYYDEATGERIELSVKSLGNWVAKTHHLLTTELGLGVGDTARIVLPCHWLSVPVYLGVLSAGLAVTAADAADVAFVAPDGPALPDAYVVAATPSGAPGDYIGAVRPQEDKWPSVHSPGSGADPCLEGLTRADVVARAVDRCSTLGIADGARVLSTRAWSALDDVVDTLLAPLVAGGSVVYVVHTSDPEVVQRRVAQERASVRVH
jgi:uncharacterized protein (TIGR03089 family)